MAKDLKTKMRLAKAARRTKGLSNFVLVRTRRRIKSAGKRRHWKGPKLKLR
ncbi:MAG: hypothetical protein QW035_02150 [Candidatus Anstonellales archaeon]